MNQRCSCGNPFADPIEGKPRLWFWLGSGERICAACVKEAVVLADHREDLYHAAVARRLAELGR